MRTMRDKLIRLQKLYIEQFGRLQHKLRESRRTYLAQVAISSGQTSPLLNLISQGERGARSRYDDDQRSAA